MIGKVFGNSFSTPLHETIGLLGQVGLVRKLDWVNHYYFDLEQEATFIHIGPIFKFSDPLRTLYKIKECVERIEHTW